ncbi:MAG: serine protease [Alphaproteobacteria bacterium]
MMLQIDPPSIARAYRWRIFLRTTPPNAEERLLVRAASVSPPLENRPAWLFREGRWSELLPESAIVVEVTGGGVEVDRIGIQVLYTEPQTPVGVNNIRRFHPRSADLRLRELAAGVGRLSLAPPGANSAKTLPSHSTYCTVFLVRSDRVMTAAHCVDESLSDRAAEVIFGLVDGPSGVAPTRMSVRLVEQSLELDAALLAIDPPVSNVRPVRFFSGSIEKPFQLTILHHVGGDPLSISDDDACEVVEVVSRGPPTYDAAAGRETTILDAGFKHGCDTAGSSSGSPIVDRQESKLVGMHRRGYREGEQEVNQGIRGVYLQNWLQKALRK